MSLILTDWQKNFITALTADTTGELEKAFSSGVVDSLSASILPAYDGYTTIDTLAPGGRLIARQSTGSFLAAFLSKLASYEPNVSVSFASGWGNTPGFAPVTYYKDAVGVVHLTGMARASNLTAFPGLIFTLPTGYRPAGNIDFACCADGSTLAVIRVSTAGDVSVITGPSGVNQDYSVSNIAFRV